MNKLVKARTTSARRLVGAFLRDESGSTAIEYGLIAVILTVALVSSLLTLKQSLMEGFYEPVVAGFTEQPEG